MNASTYTIYCSETPERRDLIIKCVNPQPTSIIGNPDDLVKGIIKSFVPGEEDNKIYNNPQLNTKKEMNNQEEKIRIPIIAVHGLAGVGKDTAVKAIMEGYGELYDIYQMAIADRLKKATRDLFGFHEYFQGDENKDKELGPPYPPEVSYRGLIISIGDTVKMFAGADVFIRSAHSDIILAQRIGKEIAIISDTRYQNEVDWVQGQGGLVIHISRINKGENFRDLSDQVRRHESERDFVPEGAVCVVNNDIRVFRADIVNVVKKYLHESSPTPDIRRVHFDRDDVEGEGLAPGRVDM